MADWLALDWGGRKVGYATASEDGLVITPRGIFERFKARSRPWELLESDLQTLKKIVREFQPDKVLLGLPLNADGTESEGSRGARELAPKLGKALGGLEVILVPEILTSWDSRGEALEDASAAATLLRDYFAERKRT